MTSKPNLTTKKPYTPIACTQYDRYERAMITRLPLAISWQEDDGQRHQDLVVVRALETVKGQEFLDFEDRGQHRHRVRLDAICLLD